MEDFSVKTERYMSGPRGSTSLQRYVIRDMAGKIVASAHGFYTDAYLKQAIGISLRALHGMRPLPVIPKEAKKESMWVVENWNDKIYGPRAKK